MFSPFYSSENETRKPYVLQKVQIEKGKNQISEGTA